MKVLRAFYFSLKVIYRDTLNSKSHMLDGIQDILIAACNRRK